MTDSRPTPPIPTIVSHTTRRLRANASRTSERSGSSSEPIAGIAAYAIWTPDGKSASNAGGSVLSRRFWRIVDPTVTPHVWAKVREKEKKASAEAVRETGSGARVGKTVAVYCGAAHAECGEQCIQGWV